MNTDAGIALFSRKPRSKQTKRQADYSLTSKLEDPRAPVEPAEPNPASTHPAPSGAALASDPRPSTAVAADGVVHSNDANSPPESTFRALGLSEWLDKVCRSLGMKAPTPVQQGCIPAILNGHDVIGVAHTGSGKTAAFALPILQRLSRDPYGVFALVLTPTRELAFQIADQFRALGAGTNVRDCVIVGGLDPQPQAKELARRPHVVIATPGRLRQLLEEDADLARGFARAAFLVLDEADRLLEPSFEPELAVVLQRLPAKRQTLLFSATMTRSLVELQTSLLPNAYHFQAYTGLQTTGSNLKEQFLLVPAKVKEVYLAHLLESLEERSVRSAIVFVGTCRGCALLAALLEELGLPATALHSHLPQRRRMASLNRFKGGAVPVLLATDVASRGLDIPTVDLVINFDLPTLARDYVHRVGRTARAGRRGWSLSFVSQHDVELVQRIEALTGSTMDKYELEEGEVLKGITKVYAARRVATMRIAEEERRNGKVVRKRATSIGNVGTEGNGVVKGRKVRTETQKKMKL
jgi:ATP-dependent RNA helicase DDX49/DBP8